MVTFLPFRAYSIDNQLIIDSLLVVPSSYWTLTLFADLSLQVALYQVSVRWVRYLPLTSFRFRVTTDTLVSLARRFPLLGLVRDLHPLDNTHASQTKKTSLE